MDRLARCLTLACFLGCALFAIPTLAQTFSEVTGRDLERVELRLDRHDASIDAINAKLNWMMGGIAVILGLMGLMNIQARITQK